MPDYIETDATRGCCPVLDLIAAAEYLDGLGIRCALWPDRLRVGRVCIHHDGRVTVEGGADARHLEQLVALLRAGATPDPDAPPPAARPTRRVGPRELRGEAAQAAVAEFVAACERELIEVQRLRPGCWLVAGRVFYHPTSGRVRPVGGKTLPGRGLGALYQALARAGSVDVPAVAAE